MPTTQAYSRRHVLSRALTLACGYTGSVATLACAAEASREKPLLVCLFLRGGVDALSVVAPYAEDDYYRLRPSIALPAPGDNRASAKDQQLRLTDHFGLHPALAPLKSVYDAGELAIVHACGSADPTHSHFQAMATMERGLMKGADTGPASGWLARYLNGCDSRRGNLAPPPSAARVIAVGSTLPQSLMGAPGASVIRSAADLGLDLPFGSHDAEISAALASMYGGSPAAQHLPLQRSGAGALRLLRMLADAAPAASRRSAPTGYPADDLGSGLSQVAYLARAGVGLEIACLDQMGYDTHVAQGSAEGQLAGLLKSLAQSLAAFRDDLGPALWARTTVVVQSEFGRRVEENSGMGTDHGSAGIMLLLGGRVRGGKIWGEWPTLASNQLDGPGDLRVTTDYRNVLAEALATGFASSVGANADVPAGEVFPGLSYKPLGIFHG